MLTLESHPNRHHGLALGISNKAIYGGAAINHVSKLLRGNIVTNIITTTVLSSEDITRS